MSSPQVYSRQLESDGRARLYRVRQFRADAERVFVEVERGKSAWLVFQDIGGEEIGLVEGVESCQHEVLQEPVPPPRFFDPGQIPQLHLGAFGHERDVVRGVDRFTDGEKVADLSLHHEVGVPAERRSGLDIGVNSEADVRSRSHADNGRRKPSHEPISLEAGQRAKDSFLIEQVEV